MANAKTPVAEYDARIARGEIEDDPAQRAVLNELTRLHKALADYKPRNNWLLSGVFGQAPKRPKGLYVYGGVGRGKSMLMDLFFDVQTIEAKRRVHFHAFMQEIHAEIHALRQSGIADPIKPLTRKIAADTTLLCFDEMQITDITDAMLVGRLFEGLFDQGTMIVTTSNRPPDDLYKDGLNRNLFLPFIGLLKERLTIHNLDSDRDYRQDRLAGETVYFTPLGAAANTAMAALWGDLTAKPGKLLIPMKGRTVTLPLFENGVGRASFADLCGAPLGPGDYLAIAKRCRVFFLTDIPILSPEQPNEAKRFVTLIDAFYEAGTRLIATAAAQPEELYKSGKGRFEFDRTASRLREMMSADWAAAGVDLA